MRPKFDPDSLLSQILTGFLLVSYVAVVYVVVVALGMLPLTNQRVDFAPPWWINLIALIAMAVTFFPVYRWVRAGVNDLVYSHSDDPYPALSQLNRHLESTSSPHLILPAIAESIARTLKLPYIEIHAQRADLPLITVFGQPPKGARVERLPLTYQNTLVGDLQVSARHENGVLSKSDLAVLHDLAQQVGIALYAAQLTGDLQRVRERLVIAREEERRRIRNDLHDGLAPTLSSIQLQLGAVRNLMRENPDQAENIINDLREDLRNATAEIRQLVYALRPPMLDELGLLGAIKSFKFRDSNILFHVNAPIPMPHLPAAVEVAVYRIASEAIHNVVKHAHATECTVSLAVEDHQIRLCVTDNGTSLPHPPRVGIGLQSMQERAAELGGTLSVHPCDGGGTCLTVQLPLDEQNREEVSSG